MCPALSSTMSDLRSTINVALKQSLGQDPARPLDLEPPEWEALWISARDHCLTPYLHRRWTESGAIHSLPPDIAARFSAGRMENTERNRRILPLLDEISSALKTRGIACLVSKGLPVAQAYYGDLGLRVLYDLDLLIKPDDTTCAFGILRGLGYEPFSSGYAGQPGRPFWRPKEYSWDAERVFDPDRPVLVELHTRPWEPRWHGFSMECNLDLWRGCRDTELAGVPLHVPAEGQLLVHLAVHYACNVLECNARLMHLLDIILLLRHRGYGLHWDEILNTITERRLAPFCFVALDLAARAGDCSLPPKVWKTLKDATPSAIVAWLESRGLDDACSMNLHNRDRSLIYFLHWNMAVTWHERVRVLAHALRTPWLEGSGISRWVSLARRTRQRFQHLARAARI
jgi:hypothetical protein